MPLSELKINKAQQYIKVIKTFDFVVGRNPQFTDKPEDALSQFFFKENALF